jgi:hypothetical protein
MLRVLRYIAMCLLLPFAGGCYHADGRPYTFREVYVLSRTAALEACRVIDGPVGDAAMVTIQGAALPVVVARGACVVVRAFPDAVGVKVDALGNGAPLGE